MTDFEALEARQRRHIFYTWSAQRVAAPVSISGGEGAWFFDHDGHRWLDFESQVFNCNAGHGEARISGAIEAQARTLCAAHPAAVFETKAALGEALARVTPGDLNHFFLCVGGAEAVENALKMARLLTGRQKVIARRRSYHGATMGALSLTGDARRWAVEPGLWGVVRAEDPYCYRCPYGLERPTCGVRCATDLERLIELEGPGRIAAIFLEGVTGASGGFVPPDSYWPTVRAICDRHGILLVSDEVFSGFGRTGRWFAVDHWGVTPDIITMAKGLTSGYAPLGAVAISDRLAARFEDETLWCGLTGYGSPIGCAAALAAIQVYEQDHLIERAAALEAPLREGLRALAARHEVIGDVRAIGLLGTLELVADRATRAAFFPIGERPPPDHLISRLRRALRARRLHISVVENRVQICPPLCISRADLQVGLELIDEALTEVTEEHP